MLTAQQTDQLVQDIQRAFPTLAVSHWRSETSGDYVVIVRDPTNQHEVRISSLRSDWRRMISELISGGGTE